MWRYMAVITSVLIAHSLCCIQCDKRGADAMERFTILIRDHILEETLEAYMTIKQMANAAQRPITRYLEEEVKMLDKHAILEVVQEYKRAVDMIQQTKFKGIQLLHTIQHQFQQVLKRVKAIAEEAARRRCPNKQEFDNCGLLVQEYTHCESCEEEKIICAGGPPSNQEYYDRCSCVCTQQTCFDLKTGSQCTPCSDHASYLAKVTDCGEKAIEIAENEDLTLDCSYQWYSALQEEYKNIVIKSYDDLPKITDEPNIEFWRIQTYESGRYMCTTVLNSGVQIAKFVYNVKVTKGSGEEMKEEELPPLPTIPEELDLTVLDGPNFRMAEVPVVHNLELGNIIMWTIVAVFAISVSICIFLCLLRKQKTATAADTAAQPLEEVVVE
ncbi:izumo sperm-egg fusion protein 1-like [Dendropsophus ebraccatus]|uniref:izumo sperm-egg fusion protein 1-like n=1 Tax=Dendropsophus ebraccatus TaxID=150705 RepID=UPI0038310CE5